MTRSQTHERWDSITPRRGRKGSQPWSPKTLRPYFLPEDEELRGHHPANCWGPTLNGTRHAAAMRRKAKSHGRGFVRYCGKPLYCAFCWEAENRLWALRGLRDFMGLQTVHFSARPFGVQDDPEAMADVRDDLVAWLKQMGFHTHYVGVHVYGEAMSKPDPHFDVVAGGDTPRMAWLADVRKPLPPLEEALRAFLKRHGGHAFSAHKLHDGWGLDARRQRRHAARYAMRCTFDTPRLWAGHYDDGRREFRVREPVPGKPIPAGLTWSKTAAHVYDLRGSGDYLAHLEDVDKTRAAYRDVIDVCGPITTRKKRGKAHQSRLAKSTAILRELANEMALYGLRGHFQ